MLITVKFTMIDRQSTSRTRFRLLGSLADFLSDEVGVREERTGRFEEVLARLEGV